MIHVGSEVVNMLMFYFIDYDYTERVSLPDKEVCLSFPYSESLSKSFLCVGFRNRDAGIFSPYRMKDYNRIPILKWYRALRYKRQSSVGSIRKIPFCSWIRRFGVPWSDDYVGLNDMKSFSRYKKCYGVIARRSRSDRRGDEETVLLLFDRYSDAIVVSTGFTDWNVRRLLGEGFRNSSGSDPYSFIEYMTHPISLLLDFNVYWDCYSLCLLWCRYLIWSLKEGYIGYGNCNSPFGLAAFEKDFDRVVRYSGPLSLDSMR